MSERDEVTLPSQLYPEAYLSGVLHGDGWCTGYSIGLRVADREFADTFASALRQVFFVDAQPRLDERGYWLVRKSNTTGRYSYLLQFEPQHSGQMAVWVQGLFDSEGNATLRHNKVSENCYGRSIEMFSTNISTLARALIYLNCLGIPAYCHHMKKGEGHKGNQPVYRLTIRGGREHYTKFAQLIGSSIPRKQRVLEALAESYQDVVEYCRAGQRKGATTKHRRLMEETLSSVLAGIRELIQQGIKTTQRHCRAIPGYDSIQRYFRQMELVTMAIEQEVS